MVIRVEVNEKHEIVISENGNFIEKIYAEKKISQKQWKKIKSSIIRGIYTSLSKNESFFSGTKLVIKEKI
ncbi:MAG: hypothetical protein ACTSXT_13600 [Candidatus Helarchaeota archaeon]